MKKIIASILASILKIALVSLLCNLSYWLTDLDKVFGSHISYPQWVSIVVIANLLIEETRLAKSNSPNDK